MKNHISTFAHKFATPRNLQPSRAWQAESAKVQTKNNNLLPNQKITITNKDSKYKLNFGEPFKDLLEPRDQVLEHQFDFTIPFDNQKDLAAIHDQQVPSQILKKVKQFLVESTSNVTSAAFKFLCKGDLTEEEAKQYASKNILLNINAIFRQTVNALCSYAAQRKQGETSEFDRFELMKQNFAINLDNMMSQILVNLADNYPQATAAGETPRMRETIIDLNRIQDETNDLIFVNNIKIIDHLQIKYDNNGNQLIQINEEGEFTKFIMEVINAAIKTTQDSQEDYKSRTVKQIFSEFNQKLFCLSQEQSYHHIMNDLSIQTKNNAPNGLDQNIEQQIVNYLDETLTRNKKQMQLMNSIEGNSKNQMSNQKNKQILIQESILQKNESSAFPINQSKSVFKFREINLREKLQKFRQKREKANITYGIGQKIPNLVKQFSQQQLDNALFTSKHSSILRILTKWAEYLQQIFQNPQKSILERMYPFKTIQNQLVILNHECDGDEKIIQQLKYQYIEVKRKSQLLIKSCYSFMSQFLSKSQQIQSSVGRYTETRVVASKINAVLTSLMLKYTNTLIHHLIKAGQQIETNYSIKNINLVVFRVSDLLRAKLQCNESSFVSLLKTMYILDNSEMMKDKFKLVRIKNKLDDPANNIMINYLFMGKVQCELQLSIQQPKGKVKNYYTFSHFIYELTRGKFGAIAECATMISQLDPMINACKGNYYAQKKGIKLCSVSQTSKEIGSQSNSDNFEKSIKSSIFECVGQKCKRLIIDESRQIFIQTNKLLCNRCIINNEEPENQINNENLKSQIRGSKSLERIKNFSSLNDLKQIAGQFAFKCLAILNDRGKLTFNLAIYNREEFKVYLLRLNSTVIQQIGAPDFDFDSLDYTDITKAIKSDLQAPQNSKQLMYVISDAPACSEQLFLLMNLDKKMVLEKLALVVKEFQEFRLQKSMILSIKFKTGIITTNFNMEKWNRLGKIVTAFQQQDQSQLALRYKKYKHVDLSTIKQIYSRHMEVTQIPVWLTELKNLRILEMDQNKLTKISKDQLPSSLTHLVITDNKLSQVNLSNLQSLSKIQLGRNVLTSIDVSHSPHLIDLNIRTNKLMKICFKSFQEVNNQLIEKCPHRLKFISLGKNAFEQIDLSMFKHLIQVDLMKNKLKLVNLNNLVNLKELRLEDNQLVHIDLSCLINLTLLSLQNNYLESIDLTNLKNLEYAYLQANKLTKIDVSNQNKLYLLNIKHNSSVIIVKQLPPSLIYLEADRSTVISYDFRKLEILKKIYISNGKTEIHELMNLREEALLKNEDE